MRAAWPQHLPMSVRISAHDWVEGGITPDDAVEIARAFKAAGADLIDCSSGQVSRRQKPVYGRMYQTPFADRVRNEAGIATMAVGAIYGGRPRQQHHRGRPRRPVRRRAAAPGQPGLDAAGGGARSATPTSRWPVQYLSGQVAARAQPRTREGHGGAGCRPVAAGAGQPGARRLRHRKETHGRQEHAAPRPSAGRGQPQDTRRLPGPALRWSVNGKVATVTLNRPERKNPLTFDSYAELRDLFGELALRHRRAGGGGHRRRRQLLLGRRRARDHRAAGAAEGARAADVHAHDGRPGQGDARLSAADRGGRRRRVRRRRRDRGAWRRTCASAPRAARPPSCSTASAWPAATWAPARSCRALIGQGRASELLYTGRSMSGEEGERWGFFNRLCAPRGAAGRGAEARARAGRRPDVRQRHHQDDAAPGMGDDASSRPSRPRRRRRRSA